jgi:hypothetical protein
MPLSPPPALPASLPHGGGGHGGGQGAESAEEDEPSREGELHATRAREKRAILRMVVLLMKDPKCNA